MKPLHTSLIPSIWAPTVTNISFSTAASSTSTTLRKIIKWSSQELEIICNQKSVIIEHLSVLSTINVSVEDSKRQ